MVMVLVLISMLKALDAIPEIGFPCQAGVAYHPHRAVYSSKTYFWIFISDPFVKVANRRMPLHLQEYVHNLLSLLAVEQPVVFQILSEDGLRRLHTFSEERVIKELPREGLSRISRFPVNLAATLFNYRSGFVCKIIGGEGLEVNDSNFR